MSAIQNFKLIFSIGTPWICSFLKRYSAKLPHSEYLKVSGKLYKTILKVNEQVETIGHPPNLHLAYVHPTVETGVFLKCDEPPIPFGAFIGIYTGRYELVEGDIKTGTSYAYDVAQGISLKKKDLEHVVKPQNKANKQNDYSVQTNAMEIGNFTRYINHSSLENNIEAVVSKLPDGRLEILLFSMKKIRPGEQLLSNYGGEYWKALKVIPNDMSPRTYLIKQNLSLKKEEATKSLSLKQKEILLPLRNVDTLISKNSEKKSLFKKTKENAPDLKKNHRKELETFENLVAERGIPRKFDLSFSKNALKVILNKKEKSIDKNKLIGSLAGTFREDASPTSLLIAKSKKTSLFFDLDQEGNFLGKLPRNAKKSNLTLQLTLDPEEDSLKLLVFSSKVIKPGEALILGDFETIFYLIDTRKPVDL